jgi:hypothetical protein
MIIVPVFCYFAIKFKQPKYIDLLTHWIIPGEKQAKTCQYLKHSGDCAHRQDW